MSCSPYDSSQALRGSSDGQCPKDWQTLKIDCGTSTTLDITVEDPRLESIEYVADPQDQDGTDNNEVYTARFLYREHYSTSDNFVAYAERTGENTFKIYFTKDMTALPGLFLGDLVLYAKDDPAPVSLNVDVTSEVYEPGSTVDPDQYRPIYVQRMFLEIAPNNTSPDTNYPLTIADIRLSIRDMCPGANFLLDDFEYTDKDIFAAIRDCIDYWNETPPDLCRYNYANFPWRYYLKKGTIGTLLRMRGLVKLRDWLPYTGGNVSVNDNSTWEAYHRLGDQYVDEYRNWVMAKKVEINIDGGWSSFGGATTGW